MEQTKYIWVGIRESDISDTNDLFSGSITIFGSGDNANWSMERHQHCRINHSGDCPGYSAFFQDAMYQVLENEPNSRFFQYDSLDGMDFPKELQDKFCFQNEYSLLLFLEHKIKLKPWAEQYVPVLPYQILPGHMCDLEHLRKIFPNEEFIVIQRDYSCGGTGTFLARLDSASFPQLPIESDELCMVTPFQANGVSVNIHVALYQEYTMLFSPSVQIIDQEHVCLEYLGADFSAYHMLPLDEQVRVKKAATTVGNALRNLGYRGVCGIDFILAGGNCYFMEVNPRFQASTALLNRYLSTLQFPSLQEYHIDAFSHFLPNLPDPPELAQGSCYTHHYRAEQERQLRWLWNSLKVSDYFSLCDDSLSWTDELEPGCYVFQLQSRSAISCITYQHKLRLHPNVKLSPFTLNDSYDFSNLLYLKILLLSRGISISPQAWQLGQSLGGVDWEEFCAITVRIFHEFFVTVPCMERWHSISPMQLDVRPGEISFVLRYYGLELFPVEIMLEDPCGQLKTKAGHFIKDIVYLNPDRLRVYHRNGCMLQNAGEGCKFCDLYGVENDFSFDEIQESLSYYWENPRIKHYLIGGGSELSADRYESIFELARYLHKHDQKHIYLMSQPISDLQTLRRLKNVGVTEVAFNIEMFDRDLARFIMPGKSKNTLQDYFDSLKNAVTLWGNTGNVRSVLLLGFDDLKLFAWGIEKLCQIGVAPILSLFRPCPGTPLEDYMPLDESSVLMYYETADQVCKDFGIKIGPSCKACQNNTVALDM